MSGLVGDEDGMPEGVADGLALGDEDGEAEGCV